MPESDAHDLPVVILCGGLGTRLRPAVADRPKVLAPVDDVPFLDHLLRHLRRQDLTNVILSTGYLGEMVRDFAGDGADWNLRIRYAREPRPLGTGGALRFAADQHDLAASFLALNGDTFFSGSLRELAAFHAAKPDAKASLALVPVDDASRYGTVECDTESDAVLAFREKDEAVPGTAWINAGAYVLTPTLLDTIGPDEQVSLERDVFPRWVGRGVYARPYPEAAFIDIGTPDDYDRAGQVLTSLGFS